MFVNKSQEKCMESLKFQILYLFSVHRKVGYQKSPPKEKSLQSKNGIRDDHTYLFVTSNIQEIHHNSEYKIRELMASKYYESPQHKLLNTAVTSCFLNTKDPLATQLQRFWETQEFHTSTNF